MVLLVMQQQTVLTREFWKCLVCSCSWIIPEISLDQGVGGVRRNCLFWLELVQLNSKTPWKCLFQIWYHSFFWFEREYEVLLYYYQPSDWAGIFPVKICFVFLNMGSLNMLFDSKSLWEPRMWDIFIAYLPQRVVTSLYNAEKIWDRQISLKIRLF